MASISEHQTPTWAVYVSDLHIIVFFIPLGLLICLRDAQNSGFFVGLYAILACYFSSELPRICTLACWKLSRYLSGVCLCSDTSYDLCFLITFTGVMVRLVLVLAPAASILAGIGAASLILGISRQLLLGSDGGGLLSQKVRFRLAVVYGQNAMSCASCKTLASPSMCVCFPLADCKILEWPKVCSRACRHFLPHICFLALHHGRSHADSKVMGK